MLLERVSSGADRGEGGSDAACADDQQSHGPRVVRRCRCPLLERSERSALGALESEGAALGTDVHQGGDAPARYGLNEPR